MAGFKRYRKDDPVSYSLGITLTFELLRYKTEYVNKVYVHSAMKEGETYDKLRRICGEAGIPIQQTDKIFHVLSKKENCYVIGEFRKFEDVLDPRASHIVLVNPSNAGNMGTIMRSALGFELNQMAIIRPAVDAFDPKVVRASMGAIFSTQFQYFDSFDEYLEQFGEDGLPDRYADPANGCKQVSDSFAPGQLLAGWNGITWVVLGIVLLILALILLLIRSLRRRSGGKSRPR